jgi:hypothetical protein
MKYIDEGPWFLDLATNEDYKVHEACFWVSEGFDEVYETSYEAYEASTTSLVAVEGVWGMSSAITCMRPL